jgi:glucose-6-phosphate 1-epimerase
MASLQTPELLNESFGLPGVLAFEEHDGLTRARVTLPACEATIYLHGAHITHWQHFSEEPILFLSPKSAFAADKAIRGGIPICFPWFGNGLSGLQKPSHGFARLEEWTFAFAALAGDELHLTFTLGPSELSRSLGYADFRVAYEVILGAEEGKSLTLRLTVANSGEKPLVFEEALHAYFHVGDPRTTELEGLESATFLDKTDKAKPRQAPAGPLKFAKQTDSVFAGNEATVKLLDVQIDRHLIIAKQNSATTVVWNPFPEGSATLADLAADSWEHFLCVEAANTGTDAITLAAGGVHTMEARITVDSL